MKAINLLGTALLLAPVACHAQKVNYSVSPVTGAIESITIEGDKTGMNWMVAPDGSQYPWIGGSCGWGLGYFSIEGKEYNWTTPAEVAGAVSHRTTATDQYTTYQCGDIVVTVNRKKCDDGFTEHYKFTNKGVRSVHLSDIGILTPFNDNYPDAKTCINTRCHAHVWAGGNSTYVYAVRMGAYAPHIGLVLTEGCVTDYEIWQRGIDKANSQTRGIIALCPENMTLSPGGSETIAWRVFAHDGKDDFIRKATALGCDIEVI